MNSIYTTIESEEHILDTIGYHISFSQYWNIALIQLLSSTYDHRVWRTGLPVRSAVLKPHAGRLVVWWVTTCESLLLYVFVLTLLFLLN